MVIQYVWGENIEVEDVVPFFGIEEENYGKAKEILDEVREVIGDEASVEDEQFFDQFVDRLDKLRSSQDEYDELVEYTICHYIEMDYNYERFLREMKVMRFTDDPEWAELSEKLTEDYYYSHLKEVKPMQEWAGLQQEIKENFDKFAKYFL